jgi:hypothetical protein
MAELHLPWNAKKNEGQADMCAAHILETLSNEIPELRILNFVIT